MSNQTTSLKWQSFVSLEWFDGILDFLFKLTAKSSEVLLAAGVILSTANHFQHGSLFTTTIIENGKSALVDTLLFQIWTWTQAIGFEASAGVVLAGALDAHRTRDAVKRNVLLTLMGGLALTGTTMLVMAFIEAATSFKERDLPTAYGVTMSVLRGVVSVAYVTVGRVKNRRFSGPEVVPVTTMPDLTAQLTELNQQLRQIAVNTERRLEHLETRTEHTMRLITEQVSQFTETHQARTQHLAEQLNQFTETVQCSLYEMAMKLQQGLQEEMATQLAPLLRTLEGLPDITASLGQIEETTVCQFRIVIEEVMQVKSTLLEQSKTLPRLTEHLLPEGGQSLPSSPDIRHLPRAKTETNVSTEHSPGETTNAGFEKGEFVRRCLAENPNVRNADIQRKAAELGRTISPAYISEVRKAFLAEQSV